MNGMQGVFGVKAILELLSRSRRGKKRRPMVLGEKYENIGSFCTKADDCPANF